MDYGKIKPPYNLLRGQIIRLTANFRGLKMMPVLFLSWCRQPGTVCDKDPWHARIINERGRIEVVHQVRVRKA